MEAAGSDGTMARVLDYMVDLTDEVGRGNFGTIYKGFHAETSDEVAMKRISKKAKGKASMEAVRSLCLKEKIVHDNVVRIYDIKQWKDSMWIIMEFCEFGDLDDFFQNHQQILKDTVPKVQLMRQTIRGIAFLHSNGIVHRDIKPGNILLKPSPERFAVVKLGDFGLSKLLDPDGVRSSMSSNVGTFAFRAPEFWDKKPPCGKISYHKNIDVYAAGLTFVAMIQFQPGKHLAPRVEGSLQFNETEMPIGLAAQNRTINNQPDINVVENRKDDDNLVKKIKSLIREMTHISSTARLSADAVELRLRAVVSLIFTIK